MTENRLTVRFSETESRALAQRAAAVGLSRAEYIRFAVGVAIQQEKLEDKLAQALDQISDQIANFQAREAKLWTLLLRVQNDPKNAPTALAALEKIVEFHGGGQ